jgi:hypothetical protein
MPGVLRESEGYGSGNHFRILGRDLRGHDCLYEGKKVYHLKRFNNLYLKVQFAEEKDSERGRLSPYMLWGFDGGLMRKAFIFSLPHAVL